MYRRYYSEIINYLVNGTYWPGATDSDQAIIQKRASKYRALNGILYHKGKGRGVDDLRYVPITTADQLNAIRICHINEENDGHYGINKTASLLSSKFYWRMMYTDVVKFVKKCPICKELNNVQWNFLQEEEKEKANTWKLIEIDILENFHSTRKNVYHVVRMVDVFSNWTSYVPLTDLNEKSIVKGVLKEFAVVGFPLSFRFVNAKSPSLILKALQNELLSFSVVHSPGDRSIDYSVHVTMEENYENGQSKPTTDQYLNQYQEVLDKHKASLYVFFGSFGITVEEIKTFYVTKLEEFCKEYPYTWSNKLHYLSFSVQNTIPPNMKSSPHSLVFGRSGGLFHPEPGEEKFYDTELMSDSFFNLECAPTRKKTTKPRQSPDSSVQEEQSLDEFQTTTNASQSSALKQTKAKKRKNLNQDDVTDEEYPKLTQDEDKILEELFPEDVRGVQKPNHKSKNKDHHGQLKSSLSKKHSPNDHKNRKRSVSFMSEESSLPEPTYHIVPPTVNSYYNTPLAHQNTPLKNKYPNQFPSGYTTPELAKEEATPGRYSFRQNLKAKGPSSFVHRFIAISTSKRGTNRIELESLEIPTPVKRKAKPKPPLVWPSTSSSYVPQNNETEHTDSTSLLLKQALSHLQSKPQPSGITALPNLNDEVHSNQTSVTWTSAANGDNSNIVNLPNKASLILNSELIVSNTDKQALDNVLKGDLFSNTCTISVSDNSSQSKETSVVTEERMDTMSDHEERDSETENCLNINLANEDHNVEQMKFNILADDLQLSDEDSLIEKVSMDIDLISEQHNDDKITESGQLNFSQIHEERQELSTKDHSTNLSKTVEVTKTYNLDKTQQPQTALSEVVVEAHSQDTVPTRSKQMVSSQDFSPEKPICVTNETEISNKIITQSDISHDTAETQADLSYEEPTVTRAETSYEPTLTRAETSYESRVTRAETSYEPTVTRADTSYEPTVTRADTSYEPTVTRAETSYEPTVTRAETSYEPTVTRTESSYEPTVTRTESSYEPTVTRAETSYKPTVTRAETSYEPTVTRAETSYEPTVTGAETSYEPTFPRAETSYEPTVPRAETSYEPTVPRAETSYEPTVIRAETSYEPTVTRTETSYEPTVTRTETSYEPTVTQTETSYEPTVTQTETSYEPTVTQTETSYEPTVTQAETSYEPTVTQAETSYEPTVTQAETSYEPTVTQAETSYEPTVTQTETSYEPTVTQTETSYEPTVTQTETSYEPTVTQTETSYEPTVTQTETSYEPTVTQTETSYEPTVTQTETSYEPTVTLAETSYEPTVTLAETSYEPTVTLAETSYEPTVTLAETSYEPTVTRAETSYSTTLTQVDRSYNTTVTQSDMCHEIVTEQEMPNQVDEIFIVHDNEILETSESQEYAVVQLDEDSENMVEETMENAASEVEQFVSSEDTMVIDQGMNIFVEDAMCVVGDCQNIEEEEEDVIILENKPGYQGYVDKGPNESLIDSDPSSDDIKNETHPSSVKLVSTIEPISLVKIKLEEPSKVLTTETSLVNVKLEEPFTTSEGEKGVANSPLVFTSYCVKDEKVIESKDISLQILPKSFVIGDGLEQFEIIQPEELTSNNFDNDSSSKIKSKFRDGVSILQPKSERTSNDYVNEFNLKPCGVKLQSLPLDVVRQGMAQSVYLRTIVYNNRKSYYFGSNKLFDMKYEPRIREAKVLITPPSTVKIQTIQNQKVANDQKELIPENIKDNASMDNKKQLKKKIIPVVEEIKIFKCPVCPKTVLPNEDMLDLHLKFHCASEVRNIICPVCSKPGTSWQALLRHYSNHDEGRAELKRLNVEVPNNALCAICRKICSSKETLAQHMQFKHPANDSGDSYKCDKCDEMFKDSRSLKRHSEKHINQNYSCEDCGYSTKVHYNYLMHKDHECPLRKGGIENIKAEPMEIDYTALQLPEPRLKCEKCKFTTTKTENLEEHVKSKHSANKYAKFKCEFCTLKFKTAGALNSHIPSHEELMLYTCKLCEYKSKYKSAVSRHAKSKHPELPVKQLVKEPKKIWQTARKMQREDTDGFEEKKDSDSDNSKSNNGTEEEVDDGIPTATLVVSQDEYGGIVVCNAENDSELAIDTTVAEPSTTTLVLEASGSLTLDEDLAIDGSMALQLCSDTTIVDGTETKVLYVSMGAESFEVLDNSAFTIIDNDMR